MAMRSVEELTLGLESRQWPSTEGRVLMDDGGERFYGYLVDEGAYAGTRVRFPDGLPGRGARRLPESFATGSAVTVYYAPDAPHLAVLNPGVNLASLAAGFLLASVAMPAGLLGLARRRRRRRNSEADGAATTKAGNTPDGSV